MNTNFLTKKFHYTEGSENIILVSFVNMNADNYLFYAHASSLANQQAMKSKQASP
jgi:hypothetical protein